MFKLKGKRVLLVGLGSRGRAACRLLCITVPRWWRWIARRTTASPRDRAVDEAGVEVHLGLTKPLASCSTASS
ncbi:MAG: hypothetical protein CM1200mP29_10110 [Verrucomicrobiota bacterium]|nr:MAG: hypothetical protein CM1200mP29_10110 [Verrucomicrobiota bacterium]